MTRHPAFEQAIDENPLEATNHLVYADWLDEQGEHDEAAFRRSMGQWMEHRVKNQPTKKLHDPWGKYGWGFDWDRGDVPDGIDPSLIQLADIQHRGHGYEWDEDEGEDGFPNVPHEAHHDGRRVLWSGYRDMEEGLRRAFMVNRAANPERQSRKFSRIVRARRRVK